MTETRPSGARLRWQCRRGMLELDELLLGYLEHGYPTAPAVDQHTFYGLLNLSDQELFDLFFGGKDSADPQLLHVLAKIRSAAGA